MIKTVIQVLIAIVLLVSALKLLRRPDPRFVEKAAFAEAGRIWAREMFKAGGLGLLCLVICALPIAVILFLLVNVR
jgi:heme O synthase-like polyprenyltransferase